MKILPVNNGYYQYKSIDGQIFKSRLTINTHGNIVGNNDTLEYENESYIIGIGKPNLDLDKTGSEFTRIFILNMLGRFVGNDKETFKVAISSPPGVYKAQKEILPEYLIGEYDVVHNKKPKKIIIDDVKIYPETVCAYIANKPEQYKGKRVIVIDIGGLTTNVVQIKDNAFTKDDVFTIEKGMYNLDCKICDCLKGKHRKCNVDDIQFFRDNKDVALDENDVLDIYREHIDEIEEAMDYHNFNYENYDMLITGGGGKILYDFMQQKFFPKSKLSYDPLFDNLKGLEILARQVWK